MLLFAFQNLGRIGEWAESRSLRWFFSHEYHNALTFLDTLDDRYEIRSYSNRHSINNNIRRFLVPDLNGRDMSEKFGGDESIDTELRGNTAFLVMDDYLDVVPQLEEIFPQGNLVSERDEEGKVLWAVHLVTAATASGE